MTETQPSVLVVDDEPNVAEAYALWLREEYHVETAVDGEEAIDAVTDETDVVLLDRRMPNVSGDEALAEIREAGYDCRVAMVTAVDPSFDIVDMAFDKYLTKPVTRDDVVETVEELVSLADYDETVREQFAVAEKRATLEAEKTQSQLDDSEEYDRLNERYHELDEESDAHVDDLDHETFKTAMADIEDEEPSRTAF